MQNEEKVKYLYLGFVFDYLTINLTVPFLPYPLFADCTWSPTMGRGLTGRRGLTQMLSGQRGVRLKSKAKKGSQAKRETKAKLGGQDKKCGCELYSY